MPVTRQDVVDALAAHPAEALGALLEHARLDPGHEDEPARALAERVAAALWWEYGTPLGYLAGRTTFDAIVDQVARRLKIDGALPAGDAWARLDAMTRLVVREHGPVSLDDLDAPIRARLTPHWKRTAAFATGASGSAGAWVVGRGISAVAATRIGALLPYLPRVGPWVRRAYTGGAVAATVGGPAAIALAVLAANQAMGTDYHRLVPLLLGVGALGPGAVAAHEVPVAPAPPSTS